MKTLFASAFIIASVAAAGLCAGARAVSVTGSATLVASASTNRAGWTVVNNSTSTLYIGYDTGVTTANGLPLSPNLSFTSTDKYGYRGALYAISPDGASDLRFGEWGFGDATQ